MQVSLNYQPDDEGQSILRRASESSNVIYVQLKRSWRMRLFSWPWWPWVAYHGEPQPMRVTRQTLQDLGDEGMGVTFTLSEAPDER